jgi:hypothetical protein
VITGRNSGVNVVSYLPALDDYLGGTAAPLVLANHNSNHFTLLLDNTPCETAGASGAGDPEAVPASRFEGPEGSTAFGELPCTWYNSDSYPLVKGMCFLEMEALEIHVTKSLGNVSGVSWKSKSYHIDSSRQWACSCGGKHQPQGDGVRVKISTKVGCKASVSAYYNQGKKGAPGTWRIGKVNLWHKNHELVNIGLVTRKDELNNTILAFIKQSVVEEHHRATWIIERLRYQVQILSAVCSLLFSLFSSISSLVSPLLARALAHTRSPLCALRSALFTLHMHHLPPPTSTSHSALTRSRAQSDLQYCGYSSAPGFRLRDCP